MQPSEGTLVQSNMTRNQSSPVDSLNKVTKDLRKLSKPTYFWMPMT